MKVEIIKNTCDPEQMRPCKNELHSPCFCTSNHPGPCKRQDETGSALEQLDSWYLSSEILSEVHDWKSWSICLTAWKARGRSLESELEKSGMNEFSYHCKSADEVSASQPVPGSSSFTFCFTVWTGQKWDLSLDSPFSGFWEFSFLCPPQGEWHGWAQPASVLPQLTSHQGIITRSPCTGLPEHLL